MRGQTDARRRGLDRNRPPTIRINVEGVDALHRLLTDERIGIPASVMLLRGVEKLTVTVVPADAPARAA